MSTESDPFRKCLLPESFFLDGRERADLYESVSL